MYQKLIAKNMFSSKQSFYKMTFRLHPQTVLKNVLVRHLDRHLVIILYKQQMKV